jgi:ferredoxin
MAEEKTKEKSVKDIIKDTEQHTCPVQKATLLLKEFMAGPMCGKCLPCPMSCYEMILRLQDLAQGTGSQDDVEKIHYIAPHMVTSSMCKKGKDVAKFIEETAKTDRDKYMAHTEGRCPDRECKSLFVYRVITDNCTMCGECKDVCKYDAVIGEKRVEYLSGFLPFEISEKRCTRCGECIKVCQYGAIEVVDIKEHEEAAAGKS